MNIWGSGRAAFWRTWQWHYRLTHWRETAMPNSTGYTSMPSGGGARVGALGGTALAVSKFFPHREQAIALIRFLINREIRSKNDTSAIPPKQPELYDLPQVVLPADHPQTSQSRSSVVARPSIATGDSYEQVTTAYFQAVHSVLTGTKRAPQAAEELEK